MPLKINALVGNVTSIWKRSAGTRGTQMIFSDMGVNPTPWGYSVYEDIIGKLVAGGIPRQEIAAVGDADSDAKKQSLFDKVRSGAVRVLIGSTQKMGTGTNVQKRLVGLHHLDAPWKPAEVEQREGRILRQGNENEEVAIYRYVTEGSFDAYMWQALETKARFIAQVITGESAVRRAEDIGGQELSYAEVKAIASGNPAVLTLAEADAELQRLAILKRNHDDEQYIARRSLKELPGTIVRLTGRANGLTADLATLAAHPGDNVTIGQTAYHRDDAVDGLAGRLKSLPTHVRDSNRISLGTYRGLTFGLVLHPSGTPEAFLEGAAARQTMLSRDSHGPRAILNALDRLAGGYEPERATARKDLGIAESQHRDYEARIGKPFAHDAYMAELSQLREQLKSSLSGMAPEPGAQPLPPVAELADRVKALTAAHLIEPAPQRQAARKARAAEEPVTARIRRHIGEQATQELTSEAGLPAPVAEAAPPPASAESPLHKPITILEPPVELPHTAADIAPMPSTTYRDRVPARPAKRACQLSLF